uniref:Ig-like domain-containing protein n=1 Tax=Canis lupus familiaris TaxID=9615 RepID=A0A8C0P7M0_CANLF
WRTLLECAFMVLWLQLGWLSGEDWVEQSPQTLRLQEGDSVSLNCSYTVSAFKGLQWYRQDPGQSPEVLFLLYSSTKENGRFTVSLNVSAKKFLLHIRASQPGDSTTYLCAARAQCFPATYILSPNLKLRLQTNSTV